MRVESDVPVVRHAGATTALGIVLDHVEHDGLGVAEAVREWQRQARRTPPPMLVGWVTQAVPHYLAASAEIEADRVLPEGTELVPVSRNWGRRRRIRLGDGAAGVAGEGTGGGAGVGQVGADCGGVAASASASGGAAGGVVGGVASGGGAGAGVVGGPVGGVVADAGGADGVEIVHEEVVSGRRFEGGGVRELRLLRIGSVRDRARDEAEIGMAAGVVASAGLVLGGTWEKRELVLRHAPRPWRVRVLEIGCSDGSNNVLFDGTAQEAHERYERDAEAAVFDAARGSDYLPGAGCGGCDLVGRCPAVPVVPGLLGVGGGTGLRSWSLSSGRSFDECPARLVAERLFLPRERAAEDSDHTRRGQAVHKWLEGQHQRVPARPCGAEEVPSTPDDWSAGRWSVTGPQARLGVQMIADHSLTCALSGPTGQVEARPEWPVVVFDPEANVAVVAKTDLFYRVGDSWAVRETKTVSVLDESDLLTQFPQLALAVVLAAEGGLREGERVRVELERLSGSGPVLAELDVDDPEVVASARAVLKARVEGWYAGPSLTAKPGKACKRCPFAQWCPERKA